MRTRIAALFLLTCSIAICADAQTTTSVIVGRVDSDRLGVSGVKVTVRSPALQGTRVTTTAAEGAYTIVALPPGLYRIDFELNGMNPVVRSAMVPLAETVRVDASMTPQTIHEEVTVRSTPESSIDTSAVVENFGATEIEYLPIARQLTDIARLAPGVTSTGPRNNIMINGAMSYENLFLVNGATVNEERRGQPQNLYIEDAIQEVTVMTSGVSAEYGRFTGGVISAITKSGGNQTSGSFRDTLTSDRWTAKTPFAGEPDHIPDINHDYSGTVGGRILLDRLWFFASGRYARRQNAINFFNTNIPFTHSSHESRAEAKMTGNLTQSQSLVASYLSIRTHEDNVAVQRPADPAALYSQSFPNALFSAHYTGIFRQSLVAEVQYNAKKWKWEGAGGANRDRILGTQLWDLTTSSTAWAPTFCSACPEPNDANNHEVIGKLSWFISLPKLGNHTLVAGVDDFHATAHSNVHQTPSDFLLFGDFIQANGQYYIHVAPDEAFIDWQPILFESLGSDFATRAVFVNDRADFGKYLTATVGLRYDGTRALDAGHVLVANDALISPRLGIVYDVRGNGRDRLTASASRYAAALQQSVAGSTTMAGNSAIYEWVYEGEELNADGDPLLPTAEVLKRVFQWFDSVGGTQNREFLDSASASTAFAPPSKLKAPAIDEVSIGYGHQFGSSSFIRSAWIRRHWNRFYVQQVTLATGVINDITGAIDRRVLTTTNQGVERDYTGVVTQGAWKWRRFTANANYTWSKLRGNVDGENNTGPISTQDPGAYFPEYTGYAQFAPIGYLSGDVRHYANAWLSYDLRAGRALLDFTVLQQFHSGRPYSVIGAISLRGLVTNPGYVAPPTQTTYYFSGRGALRTPNVSSTGFGLNFSYPVRGVEVFAQADVLNIFDRHAIDNAGILNTTVTTAARDRNLAVFNPRTTAPVECPANVKTSDAKCKGIANYQLSSTFGTPLAKDVYQAPRSYDFSIGVRF
jgi:hypothetical protein